jgi:type IV secretory pathway ATPase VirB11/archaellum biosynthesis ATPase
VKTELMAYVLMRLGVCRGLPVSSSTAEQIVEYLANKPNLSARRRMQELNAAARILNQHVDESDPVVDRTLAGVLESAAGPDGLQLQQPPVRLAQ